MQGCSPKRKRTKLGVFKSWVKQRADGFVGQAEVTTDFDQFPHAAECNRAHEVETEMVVTPFYDGAIADTYPSEYSPDPHFCRTKKKPDGWKIKTKEFFKKKDGKIPLKVTLTGPAGSGKTTLLKRYVRDNPGNFNFVLCVSNFERIDEKMSIFDFLFPNQDGISADVLKMGYEWMKANPHEITFVIDSLDTLPFKLSAEDLTSNTEGDFSPETILSSIMARKMFPQSQIISSSREHGITEYAKEIRADRIISLVGLAEESMHKHVNFVLKEDEEEKKSFSKMVKIRHPGIWALCNTPLFLAFTLIAYLKCKLASAGMFPSTMSAIMIKLLQDLFLSTHGNRLTRQGRKNMHSIMEKFKKLSYLGILKNKVTFTENDLHNAGLDPEKAAALSIFVPFCETRKHPHWKVLRGRKRLFFCHQCIQEILAAIFVIEMKIEDFIKFVDEELQKQKLSVVRRFLSGLLLNNHVMKAAVESKLLQGNTENIDKKRKVLLQHLEKQLTMAKRSKADFVELYISLYEAGEGIKEIIYSKMKYINLHGLQQRCKVSDVHAIGSIMKYCHHLHEFNLSDCGLTAAKIEALDCGIDLGEAGKRIQVDKFLLKFNWDMGEEGILALGAFFRKFQFFTLKLDECALTATQLSHLAQRFEYYNIQVQKLQLEQQEGIEVSEKMLAAVLAILPHVTKRLDLRGWIVSDSDQQQIKGGMTAIKRKDEGYCTLVICGVDGEHRIEPERIEDVFQDVCRRFQIAEMRKFAVKMDGLKLRMEDARDIKDNYRNSGDVNAEKIAYLHRWKEIKGKEATASVMSKILERYCGAT